MKIKVLLMAVGVLATAAAVVAVTKGKQKSLCKKCGCADICGCNNAIDPALNEVMNEGREPVIQYTNIENPAEFFKRGSDKTVETAEVEEGEEIAEFSEEDLVFDAEGEAISPRD